MAQKITVLLVDDNEDTRLGTQRLLEVEDDRIQIVGIAENGLEAIEQVKHLNPHVVLMDINMPVMDGLTATARIHEEAPRSMVIIVSVQDDPTYMREAFRAGAVDFVAKPISSEELAAAIERAFNKIPPDVPVPAPGRPGMQPGAPGYAFGGPSEEGHVIGIVGPKGGVGKTTLAVNLGIGLLRQHSDKRVAVVDGNLFFGDVGVFLNTRGAYSTVDLALMAEDPDQLDPQTIESALVSHESGLKMLVAPANPSDAQPVQSGLMVNLLRVLKREFNYVVVDTATQFDEALVGTIEASDRLVLVTTATMPSLKNTRLFFNELNALEYSRNNVFLVLNRMPKTSRITPEQISTFLSHPISMQIPDDPAADEALNRGVALASLDPRRVISVKPILDLVELLTDSFARTAQPTDEESERARGSFRLW